MSSYYKLNRSFHTIVEYNMNPLIEFGNLRKKLSILFLCECKYCTVVNLRYLHCIYFYVGNP